MAYQQTQQDDDELASAIYGNQAQTPGPQPSAAASWTGTQPTAMTGGSSPSAPQPAPSPSQPSQPPGGATPAGGDLFSAIYNQPQGASGNMSDYASPQTSGAPGNMSDYANPSKVGGSTPQGTTKTPTSVDDPVATYRNAMSAIGAATDPTERAKQQDSLTRTLFTNLQQAGHDVKYDGDVMVIDGRRYTVGGGAEVPGGHGGVTGGAPGGIMPENAAAPAAQPGGQMGSGVGKTEGFDSTKYGKNDPKYVFERIAESIPNNDPDRAAKLQAALRADPSGFFKNATINGDILDVGAGADPSYNGITSFDIQRDTENGGGWQWNPAGGQGGGGGADPMAQGIYGIDAAGAAGVHGGSPVPAAGNGAGPAAPGAAPGFTPSAPTYTPASVGTDDIPSFTTEGLAQQMGGYTPDRYNVGNLDAGPVANDTESLVQRILKNPESLDQATTDRMKVQGREEAADALRADTDNMTALGYENGIESAPWLQAQKLGLRSAANESIQRNNRSIDLTAAQTNAADRRSAAGVGSAFLSEQGTRQRGNEALQQSGAQMNESNSFNAAQLQSNNVANSAKLSLDAAAQRGDRMALDASVKQAATQLGQSADKIRLDYITSTMQDLTQRYGINVEAELKRAGINFDYAQLKQAGGEFQQELMFKIQQMKNQFDVDQGGLALGWGNLQQRANEADQTALMQGIYG